MQNKIITYIHFPMDPSVGLQPTTYQMEIMDFRMLKDDFAPDFEEYLKFVENVREEIKRIYTWIEGEYCAVRFDYEIEEMEKTLQ